ncbi:ABC transporter ATP-binding protein [Methanoculleus sp.]|jgi:putative ABC transport system ATP-binding protein|uniref:ABC transporter ATP-binding protein n=1 Tax=Methanoculleus sp. TaxID=90427 RepID=UPI002629CAF8|nr:ABC transporter ATP-binding protein [Methanoculleus sp.]MDI6866836.1 ABC transporter ATP-binding protein [Methanoculleus sp.]
MPVISFENVTKVYPLPAGDVVALDGVDIAIDEGEFVLIMGPSGSGKSTLLNIMGSLDVPTSGEVTIAGRKISGMDDDDLTLLRRDHIGFVFQQFNLIPLLSVVENVEYPLILKGRQNIARNRAKEVLMAVGIAETHFSHKPGELSGGQQQRVAIARALVNDPDFLLCDEPTGNLDSKTGTAIMDLLSRMNRDEGKTIVMVTHDIRMTEYADRTIQLEDGRVVV